MQHGSGDAAEYVHLQIGLYYKLSISVTRPFSSNLVQLCQTKIYSIFLLKRSKHYNLLGNIIIKKKYKQLFLRLACDGTLVYFICCQIYTDS